MMSTMPDRRITIIGVCIGLIFLFVATAAQAGTIQVPKGQVVKLRFPAEAKLSSKELSTGVPIACSLEEPIAIGGITVVEAGASATATVSDVQPAKKGGKPGYLKVEFTSLDPKGPYQLLTGDKIKLTGSKDATGKGRKLLSYIFIAGLFIKGTDAVLPTGQVYQAEVAEGVVLESK